MKQKCNDITETSYNIINEERFSHKLKLDLIKYINDLSCFLCSYKKMARQDPLCRKVFGITSTSFFDYVIAHQNLVGNGAFVYIRMTIK